MSPSKWKYAILAILVYFGLSSAPGYFAKVIHSNIAEPNTVKNQPIGGEVHGAIAPTNTPVPTIAPTEALTPTQTPSPTNTPVPEPSANPTPSPTHVYIAPTKPYIPPTQEPDSQTNSQLDNNNYYTNMDGNQVHSPANSTDGSVPAGASAKCADGTYSFSQHRSGTCSHHGGVAQWL